MAWEKVIDGTGPFVNMGHCRICDKLLPLNNDGVCEACVKKYHIESKENKSGQILVDEDTFFKDQADNTSNDDGREKKSHMITDKTKKEEYNCHAQDEEIQKNKKVSSRLPAWKIVKALNSFYSFFKAASITVCSILGAGWLIYCFLGLSDDFANQAINTESYAYGITQTIPTSSFNPHWNVLIAAALILILGLFLAYFSQAIAKIVESLTEKNE